MIYKLTIIFFLLTIFTVSFADLDRRTFNDESDYRGKIFKEIRIDESGILLIDSADQRIEYDLDQMGEMGSEIKNRFNEAQEEFNRLSEKSRKIHNQINLFGESLILEEDEYVKGSIVIVGGNATIRGHVVGSITVPTGRVRVTSTGVVEGSITAKEVIEELGSEIRGSITEASFSDEFGSSYSSDTTTTLVVFLIIQFLAALGAVVLFKKPIAKFKQVYQKNIFKSFFIGIVLICLLPLAIALLCITIIGIPIAVMVLPLALIGAGILGAGAFCLWIADLVRSNTDQPESLFYKVLVGYIVLQSPLMASIFGSVVGSELIYILFGVTSIVVNSIVVCSAVGAAFFTRFGTRYYQSESETTINVQINT